MLAASTVDLCCLRRASATLLLAIFSFMLISPALAPAGADAELPLCCRRGGAHHCAMIAARASTGPAWQPSRCASYPAANAVPLDRLEATPVIMRVSFGAPVTLSANRPRTQSLFCNSFSRAQHKRGPPPRFS